MKPIISCKMLIVLTLLCCSFLVMAAGGHDDNHGHDAHELLEQVVIIDSKTAEKSKIKTDLASSGIIRKQVKLYGKTVIDPSYLNHIRARFPGAVIDVTVHVGDRVSEGDILAYIESNESLKKYPITAHMPGVVVSRHANPGEMALNQVLFTLANYEKIWVELLLFPGQLSPIKAQQNVLIKGPKHSINSTIEHIIPPQDENPYSVARILINNQDHKWTTGLLVSGLVTINTTVADIAIPTKSIQIIDNKPVVFVKTGQSYKVHHVELGQSDNQFTEIISGLNIGDEFVTENSYLIKADLEKSGASHHH